VSARLDGTMLNAPGIAISLVGLARLFVWWRLLAHVDRWRLEGRAVRWGYPVGWAAIQVYHLTWPLLLISAFRRLITPKA
jgi:hypothetical protein